MPEVSGGGLKVVRFDATTLWHHYVVGEHLHYVRCSIAAARTKMPTKTTTITMATASSPLSGDGRRENRLSQGVFIWAVL
jgi:hypothetical protein